MGVEHDLAVAVDRALARAEQLIDIGMLDRVAAELDLDIGDVADQAAGAEAGPDVIDGIAGHPLGQLDRLAHRELARRHVGDIAALDPAAFALAGAEHGQAAVVVGPRDHRADLGRADVEGGHQQLVGRLGHRYLLSPAAGAGCGGGTIGSPGARGRRTTILPGMRRSKRTMPRPSNPFDLSSLGELGERCPRRAVAFGQGDRLARLEVEVPAAAADPGRRCKLRLQRRNAIHQALESRSCALAPGPISSGRSGILSTGMRSSTTPSLSINASRPGSATARRACARRCRRPTCPAAAAKRAHP